MKRKYVILIVFVLFAIVLTFLTIRQRNNLEAFYLYLTLDEERSAQKIDDVRDKYQQILEKEHSVVIKPPSREQNDALLNGEISPEELKESLGLTAPSTTPTVTPAAPDSQETSGTSVPPSSVPELSDPITPSIPSQPSTPTTPTTPSTPSAPTGPQKSAQELINECTAKLYALEIDIMSNLGVMKKEIINEWRSLPFSEKTHARKMELGFAGLNKCYDYEVSVDTQVQSILNDCRKKLKAIGAETSVLETLWNYYCEKKASEKAYYLNKYL